MEEKKVRIATATDSDITQRFMDRRMGDYVTEGGGNSVKVIIKVAYRESILN